MSCSPTCIWYSLLKGDSPRSDTGSTDANKQDVRLPAFYRSDGLINSPIVSLIVQPSPCPTRSSRSQSIVHQFSHSKLPRIDPSPASLPVLRSDVVHSEGFQQAYRRSKQRERVLRLYKLWETGPSFVCPLPSNIAVRLTLCFQTASNRYAPHLSKCLGLGQNRRATTGRIAAQRAMYVPPFIPFVSLKFSEFSSRVCLRSSTLQEQRQ